MKNFSGLQQVKTFRRGNLAIIMRKQRGELLLIYRSAGKLLTIPEQLDEVIDLEAHWEAITDLVEQGSKRVRFDFSSLLADKDVWTMIDFDLHGLTVAGVQVEVTNQATLGLRKTVARKRNWGAVVEEWHRVLVGLGIGLITLVSIISLLAFKMTQMSAR